MSNPSRNALSVCLSVCLLDRFGNSLRVGPSHRGLVRDYGLIASLDSGRRLISLISPQLVWSPADTDNSEPKQIRGTPSCWLLEISSYGFCIPIKPGTAVVSEICRWLVEAKPHGERFPSRRAHVSDSTLAENETQRPPNLLGPLCPFSRHFNF